MKKILVIEDEKILREEIVDSLGFRGFTTFEAPNGVIGLQLAKEHLPDLIISDITMPEMGGFEVLTALREEVRTANIPFIFLSARVERSFVRHGMELGADDYLTKPFTLAELLASVDTRLEKQTKQAQTSAQELDKAKQTLMQMVSHELRTPLISMTMVQDIIERQMGQISPKELKELFETLHHGSHRLRHLVEQTVFLTQLEAGTLTKKTVFEQGSPSLSWAILTGAISLAKEFVYRNRDSNIRLDERDGQVMVKCHIQALKHGLAELIANALNFSADEAGIDVSQWQADGFVWINIVDQGFGMTPEQVSQAMSDFQQIGRQNREQQGMGLGLPIARRIIEAHGGVMEVTSVVNKGTQVLVKLPLYVG